MNRRELLKKSAAVVPAVVGTTAVTGTAKASIGRPKEALVEIWNPRQTYIGDEIQDAHGNRGRVVEIGYFPHWRGTEREGHLKLVTSDGRYIEINFEANEPVFRVIPFMEPGPFTRTSIGWVRYV